MDITEAMERMDWLRALIDEAMAQRLDAMRNIDEDVEVKRNRKLYRQAVRKACRYQRQLDWFGNLPVLFR